jgi:hypothetical protein
MNSFEAMKQSVELGWESSKGLILIKLSDTP